jgi:hypothetical protein
MRIGGRGARGASTGHADRRQWEFTLNPVGSQRIPVLHIGLDRPSFSRRMGAG